MNMPNKSFISKLIAIAIISFITYFAITKVNDINNTISLFWRIMTPFFIGFGISYILNQPLESLKKRFKVKHGTGVAIIYLTLITIILIGASYFLPIIINNLISMSAEIPKGINQLNKLFQNIEWGPLETIVNQNMARLTKIISDISSFIINNLTGMLVSIGTGFMNIFFGMIISIYLLIDKDKLIKGFGELIYIFLGEEKGEDMMQLLDKANNVFSHYIIGLILEAIIVGIIATIVFTLTGVHYAVTLGFILCITNVIPYIGPFIGAIPAIGATLLYNPMLAVFVTVFIIVLQQFDANFIGPRIMNNLIGLDPIWIIFSITVGGGFFGFLGILLAIPTGAFIKIVLSQYLESYDKIHHNILAKSEEEENQQQS